MRRGAGREARAGARAAVVALGLFLVLSALVLPAFSGLARASSYPPLTGGIHGPTTVGMSTNNTYDLSATGGPAVGFNGTQIGILSFSTTVLGTNTSSVQFLPTAGVLTNGSASLTLKTSNLTQTLTLTVEVTSGYHGDNLSTNFTYTVVVVQPFVVQAVIVVVSDIGTQPFNLTVLLDGQPVGVIRVPSLTARATYSASFSYVDTGLSPGWHTFTLTLANEHGLVLFSNGAQRYTDSFYVAGPAPNYTLWYISGAIALVAVIFIWLTAVAPRRRGRKR